jgi:hypothetical protein
VRERSSGANSSPIVGRSACVHFSGSFTIFLMTKATMTGKRPVRKMSRQDSDGSAATQLIWRVKTSFTYVARNRPAGADA